MERIVVTLMLVTLTIAHVQGTQEDIRNVTAFIEESGCLKKENIDITDVFKIVFSGKEIDESSVDMKLKCFAACILEFSGTMDGCSVVYGEALEISDEKEKEEAYNMLDTCKVKIEGDDRCECAFQMVKCLGELAAAREEEE